MKQVLVLFVLIFVGALAAVTEDYHHLSLQELVKVIDENIDGTNEPELLSIALDRIKTDTILSIDEEIQCLSQFIIYDQTKKNDSKYAKDLLSVLNEKYNEPSDSRQKLLQFEVIYYSSIVPDNTQLVIVMKQAEENKNILENQNAIGTMTYFIEMGEAYAHLADEKPENIQKAREFYNQALSFPIFLPMYRENSKLLSALYERAAIGLVGITNRRHDLEKLWFEPFARATIKRMFPDKAQYINRDIADPTRIRIEVTVADWLRAMIVDLGEKDEVVPHLKVVLQYVIERNSLQKK